MVFATLGQRAHRWLDQSSEPVDSIEATSIRHVGRVAGMMDAAQTGADVLARKVELGDDAVEYVMAEVRRLGPAAFSAAYDVSTTMARKLSSGRRRPGPRSIAKVLAAHDGHQTVCALDGCNAPVHPIQRPLLRPGSPKGRCQTTGQGAGQCGTVPNKHLRRRAHRKAPA